jgi:hypothetical protein
MGGDCGLRSNACQQVRVTSSALFALLVPTLHSAIARSLKDDSSPSLACSKGAFLVSLLKRAVPDQLLLFVLTLDF